MATEDPARQTRERLLAEWNALLVRARGGAEEPDPAPYGEDLLDRWSEPQRQYHDVGHLAAVLRRVDELAARLPHFTGGAAASGEPEPGDGRPNAAPAANSGSAADTSRGTDTQAAHSAAAPDLDTVRLAAWFHDAVYRPDRSENEERSAGLARRALPEAGVGGDRTAEVVRLVRLTVGHDPEPGDIDGELLCDADLGVLAGTPSEYAGYAAAVRREYGFVPDADFRAGRIDVLRRLLLRPRLFRTPYAYREWEDAARRNVGTEIELLASGG